MLYVCCCFVFGFCLSIPCITKKMDDLIPFIFVLRFFSFFNHYSLGDYHNIKCFHELIYIRLHEAKRCHAHVV